MRKMFATYRPAMAAMVGVALSAAVILGVGCGGSASTLQSAMKQVSNAAQVAGLNSQLQAAYSAQTYDLNPSDLLSIPGSADIISINLTGENAHALPGGRLADVKDAVAAVEQLGDCGFVFLNVSNGHGLAYNADKVMYVASAAKAPFIYHLVTTVPNLSEDERQNVEWAIVDSENEAFNTLFFDHIDNGYDQWMTGFDVYHDDYSVDFYPKMSARSLASIWADILAYLQAGSGDAEWLTDLFASTETSFIRDGLAGTNATVLNKAGWIVAANDDEGDYADESDEEIGDNRDSDEVAMYESVSDAGIIVVDGGTYLMAIVTNQPDLGVSELRVSALARALFDIHTLI